MPYNIEAARKANISDQQIAEHLSKTFGYDLDSALKSGASHTQVAEYLSKNDKPPQVTAPEQPRKSYWQRLIHPEKRGAANYPDEPISTRESLRQMAPAVRTGLEIGGLTAGGVLASPANALAPGAATVAGAGLGYAGGNALANMYEQVLGLKDQPSSMKDVAMETGKNVLTGAAMEAGGGALAKGVGKAAELAGKVIKPTWGRITGTGTGAIDEAIASGKKATDRLNPFASTTAYDKALRGEITGDEIVTTAKGALEDIVSRRGAAYRESLAKIKANPQYLEQARTNLTDTLKSVTGKDGFDIKQIASKEKVEFDFSSSPLVEQQSLAKKALEDVANWKDYTAVGLDELKKRLGTYARQAKDRSPTKALITRLEKTLGDDLNRYVPGYSDMTKGYAEATALIKDIESGLMLKKQGISGRIVADQTLRRLMSAMRDNFALRKDLLDVLGNKAGEDLSGQVAGYTMRSTIPLGLSGTGPALVGEGLLIKLVNPNLWPILVASSPRVAGEFLRMYGKMAKSVAPAGPQAGRTAGYAIGKYAEQE